VDLKQKRQTYLKKGSIFLNKKITSNDKSVFAVRIKSLLAKKRLMQGNFKAAKATADDILCVDSKNADAHYIKGKLFFFDRNYNAAIEEFKVVISQAPGFEAAHLGLAQAYHQKEDAKKVLTVLKKAVGHLPLSKTLRQALAITYASRKKFMLAEVHLRCLTQYWPLDPVSYIKLGDFFIATNQYVKAEQTFLRLVDLYKENGTGYLKLSTLYQKWKKPQKALATLKKAKLKNKSDANRLLDAQIRLLIDQNRFNEALSICSERLSQNPKDVFALNLRGIIHSQQENRVAARQDFEKAIELNPHWPAPHANMARLFLSKGDVQNAISNFESALQLNPAKINVYRDLAGIYKVQKNYPKVIRVYERALADHPKMWTVANDLAFYLAEYSSRPEDLRRALTLIHKARFHAPFNPNVEDTLAWIFYKQGRLKKAQDILEIVLNHHPHNPIFNYHMGIILEEGGMTPAAPKKPYLVLVRKKILLKDNMPNHCRID
jgi:tetratricopeptide (TPR) repeat protein